MSASSAFLLTQPSISLRPMNEEQLRLERQFKHVGQQRVSYLNVSLMRLPHREALGPLHVVLRHADI